tara:strand:- start:187 stop:873 length:687 start_codon:yes stop_codon:yes gene_type:complete
MSGGILGGGNAWAKNHKGILDHAQNLHYDHYLQSIGKSLPSAVDPNDYTQEEKESWISAMNDFNSWKAKNVPLEESGKAWWQTYPAANPPSGGGSPPTGGGNNPPPDDEDEDDPDRGPYPLPNDFFPLLTTKYDRPDMVPVEGLLDPRNPLSSIGDGALYQPGTVQSAEFIPDGIMGYQPTKLNVGRPKLVGNPYGSLELPEGWEELLSGFEEEEEEGPPDDDPKGFE